MARPPESPRQTLPEMVAPEDVPEGLLTVADEGAIRAELEAYGEGLGEKTEILALNKIDALTPALREEKAAELEAVAGRRPMLVSGVSGEGVPELLRAAWAEVRKSRGEIPTDHETTEETQGGWTP